MATETRDVLGTAAYVKSFDPSGRTLRVTASTEALDSHGTVIDQGSWSLGRARRNCPVFFNHDQRALPIGFADEFLVAGGELSATLHIAPREGNPLAEQVWRLVEHGSLRAVSVGFFPGEVARDKRDGADVVVLRGNELLEISVCGIPSNPETVAKVRARALEAAESPMPKTDMTLLVPAEAVKAAREILSDAIAAEMAADPEVQADAAALSISDVLDEVRADKLAPKVTPLFDAASVPAEYCLRGDLEAAQAEARAHLTAVGRLAEERDALRVEVEGWTHRVAQLEGEARQLATKIEGLERSALYAAHADKLTPALRARMDGKPVAEVRADLEAMPTLALRERLTQAGGATGAGAKRFEEYTPAEQARLYHDQPELFRALHADWDARGRPTKRA